MRPEKLKNCQRNLISICKTNRTRFPSINHKEGSKESRSREDRHRKFSEDTNEIRERSNQDHQKGTYRRPGIWQLDPEHTTIYIYSHFFVSRKWISDFFKKMFLMNIFLDSICKSSKLLSSVKNRWMGSAGS